MKLHHIGYLTDSIEESRSGFLLLGYAAGETTDFPAHKCKICMLYKEGGGGYFLLSKPVPAPAFQDKLICYLWSRTTGFIELVNGS